MPKKDVSTPVYVPQDPHSTEGDFAENPNPAIPARDPKGNLVGRKAIKIFEGANVISVEDPSAYAYITIYATPTRGNRDPFTAEPTGTGDSYHTARAPITGIRISQGVDYSLQKSLEGDFLISTFGDTPVSIIISGMQFVVSICDDGVLSNTLPSEDSIEEFFNYYKISNNKEARLTLSMGVSGKTQTFKCVLLKLETQANQESANNGNYTYQMSLIGVTNKVTVRR